jgi:hypothetical protein
MTKSRFVFRFGLSVLLLAGYSHATTAQILPDKVTSLLDQKYPGWKLYLETPSCKTQAVKIQAVVAGDFDGNKKTDYAVYFQRKGAPSCVAFLSDGEEYKAVNLPDMPNSFWGQALMVTPKGVSYTTMEVGTREGELTFKRVPEQKLKIDTLTLETCDRDGKSGVRTFYVYGDGKFRSVITVD